jgi:hypothetical protein
MDTENQPTVSLKLTRAALEIWDAGHAAREERWQNALTTTAVNRCAQRDKKEALPVQQAFFKETTNSLDRCRLVEPNDAWLRFLVAKYG